MPYQLKQSGTAIPLVFFMCDSSDHVSGKTGLSPTVTLSKAGGSFASPSGAVTEIANGWYKVAGNATDTATLGPLCLHATGTGADPTDALYEVVALDPQDAVRAGLTALPNVASGSAGAVITSGTGTAQLDVTAGVAKANIVQSLGVAITNSDGTAQAGAATTITLASGSSATTDFYKGRRVTLVNGTGTGQSRWITAYNGTTKVATVNASWASTPDSTSEYILETGADVNVTHLGGTAQTARDLGASVLLSPGTGTGQVKLASGYVGINWGDVANPTTTVGLSGTTISTAQSIAAVTGGVGSVTGSVGSVTGNVGGNVVGSVGSVTGNVGGNVVGSVGSVATGGITVASLAASTGLQPIRSGTAAAGGTNTITLDGSASSTTDFYANATVYLTGGTGAGQSRVCSAYNGTTKVATVNANWATQPDGTTTFALLPQGLSPAVTGLTAGDVWSYAGRTLSSLAGLTVDTVTTVTGNVNAVLANTAHGGAAATLRLGGSTSTPALYVTNSGGDAVEFASTGGNGHGLEVAGQGTGHGLIATGGATGDGGRFLGGATSGSGMRCQAQTQGDGASYYGALSGAGASYNGGNTLGTGITIQSGLTGGTGLAVISQGSGDAATFFVTAGNGNGLSLAGKGTGHGLIATGGATGNGGLWQGGTTSGAGAAFLGRGGNSHGVEATPSGSGSGISANVAGNLSGSIGSLAAQAQIDVRTATGLATANLDTQLAAIQTDTANTYTLANSTGVVVAAASKTGYRLSATGVDDIWDELQAGHATAGTFGKFVDSAISGVSTGGLSAGDIADAVWDELQSGHTGAGTMGKYVADILDDTGTSGVVVAAASKTGYALAAAGLDAVLVESGIAASSALTNDSGTQLTAINFRQFMALVGSALAGRLTWVSSTNPTFKPAGNATSATNRINATVDASLNRTATLCKVPD